MTWRFSMPLYDVVHKETKETKQIECSVHEIMEWYEANQEWQRDWSHGCATAQEVGEWKDKLAKSQPAWNEVLGKAASVRGSQVRKI